MTLFCRKLKTDPATLAPIIPYLLSYTCRSPVGRGDVETDPGGGCQLEPVLANSASADTGSVLKFTGKKITIKSSVAEPKLFNFGSGYGSEFFFALAPALFPALYYHFEMYYNSSNRENISQWW